MAVLHRPGPAPILVTFVIALALLAAPGPAAAAGIDGVLVDTIGGTQPQGKNIVVEIRAGAAEIVSIVARGNIRQGGRAFRLRRATATVAPGRQATLELRPRKARQERRIKRALRAGKTLEATIRIRFQDILGNVGRRTRTITLT